MAGSPDDSTGRPFDEELCRCWFSRTVKLSWELFSVRAMSPTATGLFLAI